MRYLIWLLRAVVFFLLLGFAVKNDQPVEVHYFLGYEWRASLVVVLLLFFVIGVFAGMLALLGNLLQQRKEIASLRRDLKLKKQLIDAEQMHHPVQPS